MDKCKSRMEMMKKRSSDHEGTSKNYAIWIAEGKYFKMNRTSEPVSLA